MSPSQTRAMHLVAPESTTFVPQVIGQTFLIPRDRIRPFEEQPREFFEETATQALAKSIATVGQKRPITIRPIRDDPKHGYEIIDGERRWAACGIAGVAMLIAWVKEVSDVEEQFEESVISNFGSQPHTPLETARAMDRILKSKRLAHMGATERVEHVAAMFSCTPVWVYQITSVLKLDPRVLALMSPEVPEKDRLKVSVAMRLLKAQPKDQLPLARQALKEGLRVNEVDRMVLTAASKAGTPIHRRPVQEYRKLATFLTRLGIDCDRYENFSDEDFRMMFEHRPEGDAKMASEDLGEAIEALAKIKKAVDRVRGKQ